MNFRKFFLIVFSITSVFLFIMAFFIFSYMAGISSEGGLISEIIAPFKSGTESMNVLILGTDQVSANTDTIIVANFNPATAKVNLISIPRDTKVSYNGGIHKINSAYSAGGSKLALDVVSGLLNTEIKNYLVINLSVFKEIVDLLGGVDYYIPVSMDYDDPLQNLHIHLKKGQQHLDGEKAEQYMRFRQPNHYNNEILKYYDGSDLKRIDAQQSFIKEAVKQKLNIKYIMKTNSVIKTVFKNVKTDITLNEALKIAQSLSRIKADETNMLKLPGAAEDGGSWYYIPDKNKTNELVKQYFSPKSGLDK